MAGFGPKKKLPEGEAELLKNGAVMAGILDGVNDQRSGGYWKEKLHEMPERSGGYGKRELTMEEVRRALTQVFSGMERGTIMPVPENPYDRWVYGFNSSGDLEKFCKDNRYTMTDDGKIKNSAGEEVGIYKIIPQGFNRLPAASVTTSDETLRGRLNAEVSGFNVDQFARTAQTTTLFEPKNIERERVGRR